MLKYLVVHSINVNLKQNIFMSLSLKGNRNLILSDWKIHFEISLLNYHFVLIDWILNTNFLSGRNPIFLFVRLVCERLGHLRF